MEVLLHANDNLIEVLGVQRQDTDAYLNGATVTVTLMDAFSGVSITGQVWPMTLSYVAGSNGDYRGTINYNASLTKGLDVIADVTVDGGAGLRGHAQVPAKVIVNRGT